MKSPEQSIKDMTDAKVRLGKKFAAITGDWLKEVVDAGIPAEDIFSIWISVAAGLGGTVAMSLSDGIKPEHMNAFAKEASKQFREDFLDYLRFSTQQDQSDVRH